MHLLRSLRIPYPSFHTPHTSPFYIDGRPNHRPRAQRQLPGGRDRLRSGARVAETRLRLRLRRGGRLEGLIGRVGARRGAGGQWEALRRALPRTDPERRRAARFTQRVAVQDQRVEAGG